jgi:hypothetical protein
VNVTIRAVFVVAALCMSFIFRTRRSSLVSILFRLYLRDHLKNLSGTVLFVFIDGYIWLDRTSTFCENFVTRVTGIDDTKNLLCYLR